MILAPNSIGCSICWRMHRLKSDNYHYQHLYSTIVASRVNSAQQWKFDFKSTSVDSHIRRFKFLLRHCFNEVARLQDLCDAIITRLWTLSNSFTLQCTIPSIHTFLSPPLPMTTSFPTFHHQLQPKETTPTLFFSTCPAAILYLPSIQSISHNCYHNYQQQSTKYYLVIPTTIHQQRLHNIHHF